MRKCCGWAVRAVLPAYGSSDAYPISLPAASLQLTPRKGTSAIGQKRASAGVPAAHG